MRSNPIKKSFRFVEKGDRNSWILVFDNLDIGIYKNLKTEKVNAEFDKFSAQLTRARIRRYNNS